MPSENCITSHLCLGQIQHTFFHLDHHHPVRRPGLLHVEAQHRTLDLVISINLVWVLIYECTCYINVTWLKYMIHICVPSMYEIAAPYIFFVTLLKHFVCVCVGVYYLALEPSSGSKSSLQSPLDPLENRWSKYLNTLSNLINTHSNTYIHSFLKIGALWKAIDNVIM